MKLKTLGCSILVALAVAVIGSVGCSSGTSTLAQNPEGTSPPPKYYPINPNRTEPNPVSDFLYEINGNSVTITKYIGGDGDIVIPAEIDGKNVTSIGYEAFYKCVRLTTVKISDGVINIGTDTYDPYTCDYGAFRGCYNLVSVKMPDSVTVIGNSTFAGCENLSDITLPRELIAIGEHAFAACDSLTDLVIPDGTTSIGYSAFWGCRNLTSLTIPSSVANIGEHIHIPAFESCEKLIITCPRDSFIHEYCLLHKIPTLLI